MASSKWQGCVESKVMALLEFLWKMASDFYEIQKWFPGMKSCERVEGAPEKGVGSVRRCVTRLPTDEEGKYSFVVEELLAQDDVKRSFTFLMTDTDLSGFQGYDGTFELCETGEHDNCLLKWSFQMNPAAGLSKEDVEALMGINLTGIAKNMEQLASS